LLGAIAFTRQAPLQLKQAPPPKRPVPSQRGHATLVSSERRVAAVWFVWLTSLSRGWCVSLWERGYTDGVSLSTPEV
jgi:hypothetical protein